MKAVLLHEYRGVEQLEYEEALTPKPGAGEVLVRVISTSVNPIDYKVRSGAMKAMMPLQLPVILGRDVAGEVTAVGANVTKFQVGDKVMGLVNHSYAEFLTAPVESLTKVPEGLNAEDAGALPLVVTTGAQLMEKGIQPKSSEVILVTGAAGSVGRVAVFVAKQHGAKVIAGLRGKQKTGADSVGADVVAALDEDGDIAALPELDGIADTVGGETLARVLGRLKKSGRVASVVGPSAAAQKAGFAMNQVWAQPDAKRLYELAEDFRDGKLRIPIVERMRLSDIRQAHARAEKGVSGKIIIVP